MILEPKHKNFADPLQIKETVKKRFNTRHHISTTRAFECYYFKIILNWWHGPLKKGTFVVTDSAGTMYLCMLTYSAAWYKRKMCLLKTNANAPADKAIPSKPADSARNLWRHIKQVHAPVDSSDVVTWWSVRPVASKVLVVKSSQNCGVFSTVSTWTLAPP